MLSPETRTTAFAEVSLSDAGPGMFTYTIHDEQAIRAGSLVLAPLGSRRLPGLVLRTHRQAPSFPTRPIERLLFSRPLLPAALLGVATWMARTYRAPIWECVCAMLPPGLLRRLSDTRALDPGRLEGWLERLLAVVPISPAPPSQGPPLSAHQERALEPLARSLEANEHRVFLLHGVTGSGKTHVYLRAAEQVIATGGQVVVLVSEIALTSEAEERLSERFPGLVEVVHSGLTPAQRDRRWARIRSGDARLVVGSRSAVFAPAERLRLVVLDEEHEWTYKQDSSPRYHARAVAIARARATGACVVLSSATPDVSTYYHALRGRFQLLSLPERYRVALAVRGSRSESSSASALEPRPSKLQPQTSNLQSGSAMPRVEVVDLRRELREGNRSIFSRALQAALRETFERGEQAILFLNRRGAATCITCRDCGYTLQCRRCEVPLAYHRGSEIGDWRLESAPVTQVAPRDGDREAGSTARHPVPNQLVCHRCNRRQSLASRCPRCGGVRIRFLGLGTQRVQQEVRALLPGARVERWDRDAAAGRGVHERLWRAFVDRQVDVVVGTQMVAKALDVPTVTLVGAVLADSGLHLPDFRAAERTFQLLTQLAGRAGRGSLAGRAIIQAYAVDHYAITAAASHDYQVFYEREVAFRRHFGYPPFRRLARLVCSASQETRCWREAMRVRRLLMERIKRLDLVDLEVVGPAPCFQRRVRGRFRWQLLLCGDGFERVLDELPLGHAWIVDVDPVSVL